MTLLLPIGAILGSDSNVQALAVAAQNGSNSKQEGHLAHCGMAPVMLSMPPVFPALLLHIWTFIKHFLACHHIFEISLTFSSKQREKADTVNSGDVKVGVNYCLFTPLLCDLLINYKEPLNDLL